MNNEIFEYWPLNLFVYLHELLEYTHFNESNLNLLKAFK